MGDCAKRRRMTSDPPHSRFGYVVERITVLTALPLTTLLPHCYPSLAPPSCPHNLIFAMSTIRKHNEFTNPPNYSFPSHRLSSTLRDSAKQPLVLVACGSFSPVTYLHLRMFEMAKDYIRQNTDFEIVGGYLSPVSDMYKKPGLLSAQHR